MAGWWWSGSSGSNSSDDTEANTPTSTPTPHPVPQDDPPTPAEVQLDERPLPNSTRQSRNAGRHSASARVEQLNRDEAALDELRAAFASELHSTGDSDLISPHQPTPKPAQPPLQTLYPTTLSCAQCFDAAYYCSSIGGQLNSVYRYGGLRSCSDLWAQWRFCMRTKTMGEEERRRRVWEWNREKEARRRVGRNSEEVWSLRTEGPPEGALGLWDVGEEDEENGGVVARREESSGDG